MLGDSIICRLSFNTAFIPASNTLTFYKNTVSPDSVKKDNRFSDEFQIKFIFEEYCKQCNKPWSQGLDEFCDKCKKILAEELTNWRSMQIILG